MAGAEIGGDASVMWTVTVDHVRQVPPPDHGPQGAGGWRQHGVDEVDDNQNFTVSIKIPDDRNNASTLANTLSQAAIAAQAQAGNPGTRVSFLLPIERDNHDQIKVDWESAALPPPMGRGTVRQVFARWVRAKHAALNAKRGKKKAVKKAANKKAKKKGAKKKGAKKKGAKKKGARKRR